MAGEAAGNHSTVDGAFVHAHEAEDIASTKKSKLKNQSNNFSLGSQRIVRLNFACLSRF